MHRSSYQKRRLCVHTLPGTGLERRIRKKEHPPSFTYPLSRVEGVSHGDRDPKRITGPFSTDRGRLRRGELSPQQVEEFHDFLQEVDHELLHHPIVLDNAYTRWFQEGRASDAELRHFVKQFSVFSNQFLVAALSRVINAPSLAEARSAKEILLNELGVIYHRVRGRVA